MNIQNEEIIIVKCPECESRYRVDSKLLTRPRTVRCVNCSYIWLYRDKNFQNDTLNEDNKDLDQNYINEDYYNQNSFGDFDYEENENFEDHQIENENNFQYIPHKNDIESSKFFKEGEDSSEFEDDNEYSYNLNENNQNKDSNEFEENKENVNQNELEEGHYEEDSFDNKENDIFTDLFSQLDRIKNSKEDDKDERKNNNNYEDDDKNENERDDYIDDYEIENEDKNKDYEIENEYKEEEKSIYEYDESENEDDDVDEDGDEKIDAKEDIVKIDKIEEEDKKENEEYDKEAKMTDDGFIEKFLNKFVWFIIFILLICGVLFTSVNFSYKLPEFGRNILKIFNIQDFNNILISDSRILISNHNDHNNLNLLLTIVNLSNDNNKDFILDEIFIKLYDDDANVYDYKIKNIYVIKSDNYKKIYCKIPFLKFIPQKIDVRIGNEKIKYK